jgi:hypothetical protein
MPIMGGPCIAYLPDGSVCRAPASILDRQRGGLVCPDCHKRVVFAHHEAAHAVVAVALGWTVEQMTVVPGAVGEGGWCEAGRCEVASPEDHQVNAWGGRSWRTTAQMDAVIDRRLARQYAIICAAGLVGEMLAKADRSLLMQHIDGLEQADTDAGILYAWAGHRGEEEFSPETERRANAMYDRAATLLIDPPARRAVVALATALIEQRTIPGPEAEAIIRKARRSRRSD